MCCAVQAWCLATTSLLWPPSAAWRCQADTSATRPKTPRTLGRPRKCVGAPAAAHEQQPPVHRPLPISAYVDRATCRCSLTSCCTLSHHVVTNTTQHANTPAELTSTSSLYSGSTDSSCSPASTFPSPAPMSAMCWQRQHCGHRQPTSAAVRG